MTGEPLVFDGNPRGYWRREAVLRYVDGRQVRWSETVLGQGPDDPTAELISLQVSADTPRSPRVDG